MRIHPLLCALIFAAAAPAGAQARMDIGQTVVGDLSVSDMRDRTGEFHDYWQFPAEAGSIYIVTLRSEDFDPVLVAGPARGDECDPCDWDDDGGGGTDARLELWVRKSGFYVIRASSFDGGRGRYTLRLEQADEGFDPTPDTLAIYAEPVSATDSVVALPTLHPGVEMRGALEPGDARTEGGPYEDAWTYFGAAGEAVSITMRSTEFDTYLRAGRWMDGDWNVLEADDDGGGGTDSRLVLYFPEEGAWEVRAGSFGGGGEGAYTLRAERLVPEDEARTADTVRYGIVVAGDEVSGVLEQGDDTGPDGAFTDPWMYAGTAGETITVRMESGDFDTVIRVYEEVEDGLMEVGNDDDGGEGTNSELTLTLPHDGTYHIHATTYRAGDQGEYTLSVRH